VFQLALTYTRGISMVLTATIRVLSKMLVEANRITTCPRI
jgi:hypothetical protein